MNFRELETYIEELSASGLDVVQLVVALHRKASFPFVTLIPDAYCRAVRLDDRSEGSALWSRCGDFPGLCVLDHHQRLRCHWKCRIACTDIGGLDPESALRSIRDLPAPDRSDIAVPPVKKIPPVKKTPRVSASMSMD